MAIYLGNKKISLKSVVPSSSAGFTFKDFFEHGGKMTNTNYIYFPDALQYSDTENVTDFIDMFSGCPNLTTVKLLDTSKVTTMYRMFRNCPNLTTIPLFDTSKVTKMAEMFYGCTNLTTIPAFDASKVTWMLDMFSGCTNLTEIHMTGMTADLNISVSTKFTREALVEILNNLATLTNTQYTLTMGSTNLAKLTEEDKAIATNKGWALN